MPFGDVTVHHVPYVRAVQDNAGLQCLHPLWERALVAEMVVLSLVMLVARGAFRSPLGNDDFKQVKLVLSERRPSRYTLPSGEEGDAFLTALLL